MRENRLRKTKWMKRLTGIVMALLIAVTGITWPAEAIADTITSLTLTIKYSGGSWNVEGTPYGAASGNPTSYTFRNVTSTAIFNISTSSDKLGCTIYKDGVAGPESKITKSDPIKESAYQWYDTARNVHVDASGTTLAIKIYIPVSSVSLKQNSSTISSLTLEAGASATLTATVNPSDALNKTVTWSSNNTNAATVENGVVTARNGGTATITATVTDVDGTTKSASCIVRVYNHTWGYTASGNTITAKCTANEGCSYQNNGLTYTLNASSCDYDGQIHSATVTDNITKTTKATASGPTYYTSYTDASTNTPTNTSDSGGGAAGNGQAPKNAGTYYVTSAIGSATAVTSFTISKKDISPNVSLTGWTYGQTPNAPVVTGNDGNGTITYSYKEKDADDSTYQEITPDNFEQIMPGDYTLKAAIAGTTNYNGNTVYCDFSVVKKSVDVTVAMDGWTYGDIGKIPTATVKSGGTDVTSTYVANTTYQYYKDDTCSTPTTSADGASADGGAPKNAGTYYVKAVVDTTDTHGEDSKKFTIAKKPANATLTVQNKTYDGSKTATVTAEVSASDLVEGESLTIAGLSGEFADKNVGKNKSVTLIKTQEQISGDANTNPNNYEITYTNANTLQASIAKKPVTFTWDKENLTYTAGTQSVRVSAINGKADGDDLTVVYKDNAAGTASNTAKSIGDYTAEIASFTGSDADNYELPSGSALKHEFHVVYLDTSAVSLSLTGTKKSDAYTWYQTDVTVTPPSGYLISKDASTDEKAADADSWISSFTCDTEGTQQISYYLKNSTSGEISGKLTKEIKIDKVFPEGSVTIKENVFKKLLQTISFGYFFKDTVDVKIEGSDKTSGVAKIEYQKVAKGENYKDEDASWTSYDGKFSLSANDKSVIYAKITDEAGRETIICSDGFAVYQDATPSANATFTKKSGTDVTTGIVVNGNTISSMTIQKATDDTGTSAGTSGTTGSTASGTASTGTSGVTPSTTPSPTTVDAANYTIGTSGDSADKLILKADYLQSLDAGTYTLTIYYNPLGETYTAGTSIGDAPNSSALTLTVNKAAGSITNISDSSKTYDASAVSTPTFTSTNTLGTGNSNVTYRYKPKKAKDSAYTSDAPKTCGDYTVKIIVKADSNYGEASATKDFSIAHNWPSNWTVQREATSDREGVEVLTCPGCNQTRTRSIAKTGTTEDTEEQKIEKSVEIGDDSPIKDAEIITGKKELYENDSIKNGTELSQVSNFRIWLEITDAKYVTEENKSKIKEKAATALAKSVAGICYVEADLYESVTDSNGKTNVTQLTELDEEIEMSLLIPEEMRNTNPDVTRTYQVLRMHGTQIDPIASTHDTAKHLLTFKTDRFSTYAIAYSDTYHAVSGAISTTDTSQSGTVITDSVDTSDKGNSGLIKKNKKSNKGKDSDKEDSRTAASTADGTGSKDGSTGIGGTGTGSGSGSKNGDTQSDGAKDSQSGKTDGNKTIQTTITDQSDVSKPVQKLLEEALDEVKKVDSNIQEGPVIVPQIAAKDDGDEANGKADVTKGKLLIELPSDLQKEGRVFYLMAVDEDGTVTILSGEVLSGTLTVTGDFDADATYQIIYEDVETNADGETTGITLTDYVSEEGQLLDADGNVVTVDTITVTSQSAVSHWIWIVILAIVIAVGFFFLLLWKKKKEKEEENKAKKP